MVESHLIVECLFSSHNLNTIHVTIQILDTEVRFINYLCFLVSILSNCLNTRPLCQIPFQHRTRIGKEICSFKVRISNVSGIRYSNDFSIQESIKFIKKFKSQSRLPIAKGLVWYAVHEDVPGVNPIKLFLCKLHQNWWHQNWWHQNWWHQNWCSSR